MTPSSVPTALRSRVTIVKNPSQFPSHLKTCVAPGTLGYISVIIVLSHEYVLGRQLTSKHRTWHTLGPQLGTEGVFDAVVFMGCVGT